MTVPALDPSVRERLARAFHEAYVARAVGDREAAGGPWEDADRYAAWADLTEEARESNRRQADDIRAKLEKVGAAVVTLGDAPDAGSPAAEFRFTRRELERLARHEHARWAREKRQAGWRYGPEIDPVARTHPCLVGYDRLPEEEKDKDRQVVERIPGLLGAVGLGIVRVGRKRPARDRTGGRVTAGAAAGGRGATASRPEGRKPGSKEGAT